MDQLIRNVCAVVAMTLVAGACASTALPTQLDGEVQLVALGENWEPLLPRPTLPEPPDTRAPATRRRTAEVVQGQPKDESEITISRARAYEPGVKVGDVITFDEAVEPRLTTTTERGTASRVAS